MLEVLLRQREEARALEALSPDDDENDERPTEEGFVERPEVSSAFPPALEEEDEHVEDEEGALSLGIRDMGKVRFRGSGLFTTRADTSLVATDLVADDDVSCWTRGERVSAWSGTGGCSTEEQVETGASLLVTERRMVDEVFHRRSA